MPGEILKIIPVGMGLFRFKLNTLFKDMVIGKKQLNRKIGLALNKEISITFMSKGRGAGRPYQGITWPPLKRATLARRQRRGTGKISKLILTETRRLRRSFGARSSETRFHITQDSVRVGTNVPYAEYHEFGEGRVKQRKILPTNKRALEIAVATGEAFLRKKLEKAKLSPTRIEGIVRGFK